MRQFSLLACALVITCGVSRAEEPYKVPAVTRWSDVDVELGGINFRGQRLNPADLKYGSRYLEPINASELFNLFPRPTLAEWAERNGLDPKAPATLERYTEEISQKLNQLFVLKTIANILDTEAYLNKQSFEVPEDRLRYAVRKILVVDARNLNDAVVSGYVQGLIGKALNAKGEQAVAAEQSLSDKGISADIVELFRRRKPEPPGPGETIESRAAKDKAEALKARETFARFLKAYGHKLMGVVQAGPKAAARAGAPAYAELPDSVVAVYQDVLDPLRDEKTLFERLKRKVGAGPFYFGVGWNEASADDSLKIYSGQFKDAWPPLILGGQNPMLGMTDAFPASYGEFLKYVEKRLVPHQKRTIRQKMANTILFKFWRNRDLLNPNPPHNNKHVYRMFNPLSQFSMLTTQDLRDTYEEIKGEIAARELPEFTITEIKLGDTPDLTGLTAIGTPSPCVAVFNQAFEKPYKELQARVLKEITGPDATAALFDAQVSDARARIPGAAFAEGTKALAAYRDADGKASCASFSATIGTRTVHTDLIAMNLLTAAGEEEKARAKFIETLNKNETLRGMMIPKMSRKDGQGNVYHYFFQRRKVEYAPMSDDTVEGREIGYLVRDAIALRRVADRMGQAMDHKIRERYVIEARRGPFRYEGVEGYRLKEAVEDPLKWIPQIFTVPRNQKNPELLVERRLIERGTKLFEQAYEMP